jgi:hypothetical protein
MEDMRSIFSIVEGSADGPLERDVFWHSLRGEQK